MSVAQDSRSPASAPLGATKIVEADCRASRSPLVTGGSNS